MTLKTLSWIGLALSGLGAIIIIAASVAQLSQESLSRELWFALGGLSLAALGAIIIVLGAYNKLEFRYFVILMASVLVLISIAFSILSRVRA